VYHNANSTTHSVTQAYKSLFPSTSCAIIKRTIRILQYEIKQVTSYLFCMVGGSTVVLSDESTIYLSVRYSLAALWWSHDRVRAIKQAFELFLSKHERETSTCIETSNIRQSAQLCTNWLIQIIESMFLSWASKTFGRDCENGNSRQLLRVGLAVLTLRWTMHVSCWIYLSSRFLETIHSLRHYLWQ
jgi:hypothetical protein